MILFENVPAITSKKAAKDSPELIVDIIRKELKDAGYKIDYKVTNKKMKLLIIYDESMMP